MRIGLRIFLQYWGLLGILAGFNIYNYIKKGTTLVLIVMIVCIAAFVGWGLAYLLYFSKAEKSSPQKEQLEKGSSKSAGPN